MEIADSIGWIVLGFLPMFGSMEVVAWRIGKRKYYKASSTKKATMKKKVSV
jgi:hypothetical protein